MRHLVWAVLAAAACVSACRCGQRANGVDAGTAGASDAAVIEAAITPPVKNLRESNLAYQAGNPDEAISRAREVVRDQPKNALAHNVIGRSFVKKFEASRDPADADAARAAFRTALEVDPRFWPALLNLAELEEKAGDTRAAAENYARVLVLQPDHPERARFEQLIQKARAK